MLLNALDFMKTDSQGEPDSGFIKAGLKAALAASPDAELYITQGFICRNLHGEVDNLLRGGSDYTASLCGAALEAEEIQIWTDIDGMHNNDPRVVDGTTAVRHLRNSGTSVPRYSILPAFSLRATQTFRYACSTLWILRLPAPSSTISRNAAA